MGARVGRSVGAAVVGVVVGRAVGARVGLAAGRRARGVRGLGAAAFGLGRALTVGGGVTRVAGLWSVKRTRVTDIGVQVEATESSSFCYEESA